MRETAPFWTAQESLKYWWRRGESNPRPKQLQPNIYARVPSFHLAIGNAGGQAYPMASVWLYKLQRPGIKPCNRIC